MVVVQNVQYVEHNVQYNGEYKSLDLTTITSLAIYLPYHCSVDCVSKLNVILLGLYRK